MPDIIPSPSFDAGVPTSPPKGLSNSPSARMFGYQQRILQRTSSVKTGGTPLSLLASPDKQAVSGVEPIAAPSQSPFLAHTVSSPPSTPIRQSVSRMMANMESNKPPASTLSRPVGLGIGIGSHSRSARSVDLVRSQWESKINDAASDASLPPTPRSTRGNLFSPPLPSSGSISSAASPPVKTPSTVDLTRESASSDLFTTPERITPTKRSTIGGLDGFDVPKLPDSAVAERTPSDRIPRARPASISSHASIMTPQGTGSSIMSSGRSQAVEDTLAQARANALKRLEARKKAKGESIGSTPVASTVRTDMPPPAITPSTSTASSTSTIASSPSVKTRSSPFGGLFEPPSETPSKPIPPNAKEESTPTSASTSSSRPSYRSLVTPPTAPSSRYVPSGLGRADVSPNTLPSGASTPTLKVGSSSDKYGSISRSDNRRLGRHLPRIASGEGGWEEEDAPKKPARRVPSTLGRGDSVVLPSSLGDTSGSLPTSRAEPLRPSTSDNVQSPPTIPSTPTSKRRSIVVHTPKEGLATPRAEIAGDEMKGLMNAVGTLPSRGLVKEDDGVTGMTNRLRLSRSTLPPSASSRDLAPAPLPSRKLMHTNWMDKQRHALAAYEYLCHVGEAQQWIEGCLDEETGFGVTEMEDGLKDGVVLAKLARRFQGEAVVKKIWTDSKHRYKQTDNIAAFLSFLRTVGMPMTFTFDPIDLYEKKNIPKVIFCIHVLSHLLAKQGLAERIGNLVGQFDFTDEQLAKTQKGLQGVAMPNFGDARKHLAREASWEPEPEEPEETEDERRDRELLECEPSIKGLQTHLRGRLARMRVSRINAQLDLAIPVIKRFQARSRGAMCRRRLVAERERQESMHDWATELQSAARRSIAVAKYAKEAQNAQSLDQMAVHLQAQARRILAKTRRAQANKSLESSTKAVIGIQAACRRCLAQKERKAIEREIIRPEVLSSISSIQAFARGRIQRQKGAEELRMRESQASTFVAIQSQLRGVLVRRKHRAREEKLDNATDYIVAIQAAARGLLARQKKRTYVKHLQQSLPVVSSLQAAARARLARQNHNNMQKALAKVEVAGSVGGLQAFLRSRLAKKQTTEQKKKLEFVQPDVIGFQAVARGYLARQEYREWKEYLQDPRTQGALVFLQSLIRGFLARRRRWVKMSDYYRNQHQIVKVQALWRGRAERQLYERLVTGISVDVPTIQNYMHLLDDTDADYQRQIRTEALRREVVRLIRENQSLETEVKDLDTKIALILKNKMTFEELARAKHRAKDHMIEDQSWKDNNSRDPFTSHVHLDRASQRKLELYEYLFFMLQTKGEYLARLLFALSQNEEHEKDKRMVETVALILFGYGQERREEYLFHKFLQISVHEEVLRARSIEDMVQARFSILSVATQYLKPIVTPYLQQVLDMHIMSIVDTPHLDLSTDPADIYRRLINEEESRTGVPSQKARDLDGNQVLQADETARTLYIQHLQELRHLTKTLLDTLYRSVQAMPFTIRLLAREAMLALRVKFPDSMDEELTPSVAKTVILPFILSAIIAPEVYGMSSEQGPIGPVQRRNLAAIANLITHVAEQDFMGLHDHFVRTPLNQFIQAEGPAFRNWVLDVASADPLETHFGADELLENTVQPKPIMITRAEIYGTLSILIKNLSILVPGKGRDPLAAVLEELEGPPIDYDRGKNTVTLRLTNRLAQLEASGPEAMQKEDWVQAKRHVLAVLRVQTGKTLYDVLIDTPTMEHGQIWVDLVHRDLAREEAKRLRGGLPPTPKEMEYQIESIRSLPFHEVKHRAIEFCMKLERRGELSRDDAFEGLLVSIASDIRQKHHLRKQQQLNAVGIERAHDDMVAKHKGFEEQIQSYHQFIDSSMASLQKGKKKPTFLSKQYFHQRSEAKSGRKAQFGTYKYTAADLYQRGILLGINQLSPNQFNEVHVVLASNEVGVFSLEMSSSVITAPGTGHAIMGREEVRMEDLLQAQFENELNLLAFEGMATFSINMLIHQINKKFYSV